MQFSELDLILQFPFYRESKCILIDVGAHIGSSAKPFAQKGWQVIAFEPEPENRRQLENNLRNYPNVSIIAKAVSDQIGQDIPFYVSSQHWGIHSLKPFHHSHQSKLTVETVRLDTALKELGVKQVSLLKIDVEGADFLALQSFNFRKIQPEIVICEFMDERSQPNFGYSHHDIAFYMQKHGYHVFVSEWAPIKEYGRKGITSVPHKFLQCIDYPLNHQPAWGNLIFVRQDRLADFEQTLSSYMDKFPREESLDKLISKVKNALQKNNVNKAKNFLDIIVENYPYYQPASLALFDILLQKGNLQAANYVLVELQQKFPNSEHIDTRIKFLNYRKKELAILEDSNQKLLAFKDKHRGQRCVIIGNGPSLNKMDLSFLKDEICFGMNRIYLGFEKWGFNPTYYVSVNPLVLEQSAEEISKISCSKFISHKGIPYFLSHSDIIFLNTTHPQSDFSNNPQTGINEGYTVTYVAIQLAYYMGFETVILIGVDHNFVTKGDANKEVVSQGDDPNHFHSDYFGKGVKWNLPDLKNSEKFYRIAEKYFRSNNRQIIDATVEGNCPVFSKADYQELFFNQDLLKSKLTSFDKTLTNLNYSTVKNQSINTGQLDLQRHFWNVNSLDEAMFGRVFTDEKIKAMSPQEKMEAWENSVLSSTQKLFIGIPIKAGWKVLEIGCGVGRIIKYLRERFAQVDGVDISENMVQFAKQYLADGKQNGEVYVNNGYDLQQLPDQNYDFVYSTIVFQHIRSISIVKSYFQETFRVLKPGGYFRLQVHDYSASSLGNFDEEGAENQQYYFYGNAYTDTQLKDLLLVKTGFDLVSLESSKPWIWATVKRPEKQVFSPLVSAIVSTYNSEKFIRGCLEDLVNQTLYQKGKLEIIIIDSASVEKEGAIAQEFQSKYPHIIYQRTPERESIYAAWNRGIKIAKGNYITNANTDDRHRPDALEKMANYLNNNPDTSLVYADQLVTTFPNDSWATTQANKYWNWPEFDYEELERRCMIGSQPMWKKSLHQKYGYFHSEFKVAGDYEFWLRIGKTEKITRFSEILGLYFENEQGLEKSSTKAAQETYNICYEYGIIQRGVQRKNSVTTDILESELISLPFRESQNIKVKNHHGFSLSTNQSLNSISDNFLIQSELVSVIVLCYNQAQYLTDAIESIVKQTYQNWECLIINDGSLDQTSQITINLVEKYPEKNIRLIEKENTGVPDSRNLGIDRSSGKFILFVDADDKIHFNFITETLAILQTNPKVGFVYTDIQKFGFEEKLESYGDFNIKRFLNENQAPVTSLFRREIYQQVGGFKKVMNEGWEDWEFWISAYQKGWLGYRLEKPYLYYRQHPAGSRQQKLHQNSVNLAVHKAIIIYLHSQLYHQQEVVWSEKILSKYQSSLITELDRLKSKLSTMANIPVQYPQISPLSEVKNRPFWSVMIPTYNPTSTLEKTLKSVLQQAENINKMQIEVVDDCSTQVNVEAVVKKIGQDRISYYRQPQNLGLVANWNDCIKRASGQWIHILHQDDLVLPGFYSSLKNLLDKQPKVGSAFCRYYYIDENDKQKIVSPLEKETPGIIPNWLEKIVVMQRIQCASIVVKRKVYEKLGGFCLEANSAADWEMWKRIAAYYPVSYEPKILACYRLHSTSESSRLIKFGGNISDTRKAIKISESYLPQEISNKLSNQAREHYAISATKIAQQMLNLGKVEVAIAQIQEALKCSQSSQVKEGIVSLFITSDDSPKIDANQLLSEISKYVQEYQKDNSNKSALNSLRQLRQQISNYWLNLPTEKLESAYLGDMGRANQKLIDSNIKYEQISETEIYFVKQIATYISQGLNQQNSIQYLLAATLYYYPHQLSPQWFVEAPIPKWFVNDYLKFMIYAPSYFQEVGEADKYYYYTLNWINYLHQKIFSNSDSKIWQDIAWFVAHKSNFIPLYFNNENLKYIYIKRAEIMELGLQSRGFNLDYVFPKRPANRKKIRLGVLSSHFAPQTETFSTLPFFEHLDRAKFEIILYARSTSKYPLEKYCQSRVEKLIKLSDNLVSQVKTIRNDDLDILLIGTNVTAITNPITLLALHRLARIQLTSTSSCVTTGMRHIDYYISGKLTESQEEAQEQYQEKLITLKGAAHCFNYYATAPEKPVVKPSRESWGASDKNIVFVSGANFYKIIPELRETWAKIIAAVPNSVLVLYPFNPNWSNSYQNSTLFVDDMRSIFNKYGVDKKRLIVIKTLPSRSDIKECLKFCDVYLDSYPFAGVNSLIEPLEIGIPIVTKDGGSFRSLMGSALLRSLSILDLIANSETEYIDLAIKLATNSEFRQQKRQEIQEKMQQNPAFLDSRSYSLQIGKLFQELFQKWQNIHAPKTIESQDNNSLTSEFINRLVGCVNLYKIDPTDQSLIAELRQIRKQIADFWLDTNPQKLEIIYQGKVQQAYLNLLSSGIQNEPQTEEEEKFLKELADTSMGLTNPKAINALLGGMLYFPPGKMLVRDAKNRLPEWLINDYKQVFESREVAQQLEKAFQTKSPHLSEDSISRDLVSKPLKAAEVQTEKNIVVTENKAENLDSAYQNFLNQLLGSVNLYYIDPSDESVVKELRQLRKQMADFWINLEPQKLENFYLGEMGNGYQALLNSGIQNQSLIESERAFLQQLATQLSQGIEAPKAINYLLAAILYCRPEQLRIEDVTKLPQWLLPDYQKFIEN